MILSNRRLAGLAEKWDEWSDFGARHFPVTRDHFVERFTEQTSRLVGSVVLRMVIVVQVAWSGR